MENRNVIPFATLCIIIGAVIMANLDAKYFSGFQSACGSDAKNTLKLILENANCPTGASVILYAREAVATCSGPRQPIRILTNSFSTKNDYENRNYTCGQDILSGREDN